MTELKEKISRNTLFTFLAHFLKLAIGFVLIPYIVGVIGKERFGLWVIVVVVTQYCGLFDLGMASPFSKYIAEYYTKGDHTRLNQVVNTGLLFYIIFSAFVLAAVNVLIEPILNLFHLSPSLYSDALFVLRVGIFIYVLEMTATSVTSVLRGLQRIDITRKVQMIYVIINAIGTVLFLKMGYGIRGLIINDLICFLFSGTLEIFLSYRVFPGLSLRPRYCSMEMFKRLFKFGIRVQTSRFSGLINFQLDKFLIGLYLFIEKVAFYEIGAKISYSLRQFSILVFPVLVPAFSELNVHRTKDEVYDFAIRLTKLLAFGVVPATVFVVFSAQRIIEIWMGPGYELSARVTQILSIGYLFNVLPLILAATMQGVGKPQYQMWGSIISVSLNLVLSITLIRTIGFMGAPLGTAIAMICAPFYFLIATHRLYFKRSIFSAVRRVLLLPLVSCFLATVPLVVCDRIMAHFAPSPSRPCSALIFGLYGLFFLGCYLAIMRVLGYFSKEEKAAVARYIPHSLLIFG